MLTALGVALFFVLLYASFVAHELSHVLTSKVFGVKVGLMSIGWGPTIAHFTLGETEYRFRLVPTKGNSRGASLLLDGSLGLPSNRCSETKPLWQRLVILGAGPACDLTLAITFLLLSVHFANSGVRQCLGEAAMLNAVLFLVDIRPDSNSDGNRMRTLWKERPPVVEPSS